MRRNGEPPPMLSYASRDFGARFVLSNAASGACRNLRKAGSRMMSGSANRLYRNGWTSSKHSGPPRLSSRTPTRSSFRDPSSLPEPLWLPTASPETAMARGGAGARRPGERATRAAASADATRAAASARPFRRADVDAGDAREKRAVASAKGARAARARAPRVAGALVTARSDALARAPAAPARTAADIPGLCGRRNVGRILQKRATSPMDRVRAALRSLYGRGAGSRARWVASGGDGERARRSRRSRRVRRSGRADAEARREIVSGRVSSSAVGNPKRAS
jgi:hypothetical protein